MTRTAAPITAGVVILMCTMLSGVAAVTVRDAACDNDGVAALASATVEATAKTTEKVAEAVASALKAINGQQTSALEALQVWRNVCICNVLALTLMRGCVAGYLLPSFHINADVRSVVLLFVDGVALVSPHRPFNKTCQQPTLHLPSQWLKHCKK